MPKIIDHIQTGKRKFIKGPGRKKDVSLNNFEDGKNFYDKEADNILFNKELNNPIKVKPMDEVAAIKPAGYKKGGAVTKKTAMMRGGMANGKQHMYAAGGAVMDNLTAGQKRMVKAMAADNKK